MLHLPNEPTAREPIVHAQGRNVSESSAPSHRNMWRVWAGVCFVIVLLAAFGKPLLGLANYAAHSSLHSYILLIPFVSGYLLYLRRDQLPKERVADLPFGIVVLACGLGVFAFTYWVHPAGASAGRQLLLRASDRFVPLLPRRGRFFLFRARLDASSSFPSGLSHFHDSNAGCNGGCARDGLKICFRGGRQRSLSPHRHAYSPVRPGFPTAEHHDRSCAGMQRHSIKLGPFDDQHPGRKSVSEDAVETHCTCRIHHSAGDFTKWLSHSRDRPPLREHRSTDDSQCNPPSWWATLFCPFVDSTFCAVVVAAQG